MKRKQRADRTRERIAQEAAKIMHEQMVRDFQQAKQKACERLGLSGKVSMPGNDEIQLALLNYLSVFKQQSQPQLLNRLRRCAHEAMRFLSAFEPRLTGPVLDGTANKHSAIQIHVFADTAEQILQYLLEKKIPYDITTRRVQYRDEQQTTISVCRFLADEAPIELYLFTRINLREAPCSPVDGKPMQRANLNQLNRLLRENEGVIEAGEKINH